mmetsp:Transcript_26852/g.52165  ORF Transcript_26852/g.52165 Transcript_26852/m.52165 type:complete len:218 (-) Transcript_26852:373-1026(-)
MADAASCPLCQRFCRPRSSNMNAWACVAEHVCGQSMHCNVLLSAHLAAKRFYTAAHPSAGIGKGIYGRLGLADAFTHIGKMVMLSGYFVTRCTTLKSHFHTDFDCTGGRAFTFMAPLFDMSGMKDGHLLCETGNESKGIARYRYQLGRAIVFGDGFVHATETGTAPREIAFLCFTFGDHKMKLGEWRKAEYYISRQCPFYKDLAGNVLRSAEISGSF